MLDTACCRYSYIFNCTFHAVCQITCVKLSIEVQVLKLTFSNMHTITQEVNTCLTTAIILCKHIHFLEGARLVYCVSYSDDSRDLLETHQHTSTPGNEAITTH